LSFVVDRLGTLAAPAKTLRQFNKARKERSAPVLPQRTLLLKVLGQRQISGWTSRPNDNRMT
jgi:hypothetical protein